MDQLLGRFDNNRGRLGILTCLDLKKEELLLERCRDLAKAGTGYIIVFTDKDLLEILELKMKDDSSGIQELLHKKFRDLIS